jgi:hypothetical protein
MQSTLPFVGVRGRRRGRRRWCSWRLCWRPTSTSSSTTGLPDEMIYTAYVINRFISIQIISIHAVYVIDVYRYISIYAVMMLAAYVDIFLNDGAAG